MDKIAQITRLFQLGWKLFPTVMSVTDEQLEVLQKLYAAYHGLTSVSEVALHLEAPRFCGHPDIMHDSIGVAKWPDGNITWDVVAPIPTLGLAKCVEYVTEAFSRWAKVAGIHPQYTPGDPRARILITHRSIDGPFGILAESELPYQGVVQCHQWYDDSESWSAFDGPPAGQAIDVVRVMTHELGHALGMNHIGAGNLLAPTYDNDICTPQAGDVREMIARYGPAVPVPPSPPGVPTGPPGAGDYVIRLTGGQLSVDGYRVTKLLGM